nr:hypothetical protein Iba_chr12fCG10010 [Ipomoea batatas]
MNPKVMIRIICGHLFSLGYLGKNLMLSFFCLNLPSLLLPFGFLFPLLLLLALLILEYDVIYLSFSISFPCPHRQIFSQELITPIRFERNLFSAKGYATFRSSPSPSHGSTSRAITSSPSSMLVVATSRIIPPITSVTFVWDGLRLNNYRFIDKNEALNLSYFRDGSFFLAFKELSSLATSGKGMLDELSTTIEVFFFGLARG